MNFTSDLTITELDEIRAYDITTGDYLFTLDELQDATIANSEDRVDITGKNGRLLNSLKRNKSVTISGTNGLINSALLGMQLGNAESVDETTVIDWVEDGVAVDTGATSASTTYTAFGAEGSEINAIYHKKADGTLGTKLTQGATATAGTKFTYNPTSKAITFASGEFTEAGEIVIFYKRQIKGTVVKNISDKYSKKVTMYIDATGEDKCGNIFKVQFYIPKADFNGTFDIALGGDQAVHAFEAMALSGACGAAETFWTYTVFGQNTPDVAE